MYRETLLDNARRLQTAVRALVRRFGLSERADVECCGMTVAQAATVEALNCCGAMRLSELSRCLGIAPSTLTRNLRRLKAAGLVEKVPDPSDARAFRARLTSAGRDAAGNIQQREEAFALDVLKRLPQDRQEQVAENLEMLLEAVREATSACCPGAFEYLMQPLPGQKVGSTCGPGSTRVPCKHNEG